MSVIIRNNRVRFWLWRPEVWQLSWERGLKPAGRSLKWVGLALNSILRGGRWVRQIDPYREEEIVPRNDLGPGRWL